MADSILVDRDGLVATITLNRPERRNALTLALIRELEDLLSAFADDAGTHAVVLAAEGTVFCAGHDLAEMGEMDAAGLAQLFKACTRMMMTIHRLPQPVIARVQGPAIAGGCHLVATCDLALASDRATFAVPGPRLGLTGVTAMVEIARAAGRKRATELLLTGEPISAATAFEWGLVNTVVPHDRLAESTESLAKVVAASAGAVLADAKRALLENLELPLAEAYAHAGEGMARSAASPYAREGVAAFLERRAPVWPA